MAIAAATASSVDAQLEPGTYEVVVDVGIAGDVPSGSTVELAARLEGFRGPAADRRLPS